MRSSLNVDADAARVAINSSTSEPSDWVGVTRDAASFSFRHVVDWMTTPLFTVGDTAITVLALAQVIIVMTLAWALSRLAQQCGYCGSQLGLREWQCAELDHARTRRRIHVPFGVAYGTDKERVKQAALEKSLQPCRTRSTITPTAHRKYG